MGSYRIYDHKVLQSGKTSKLFIDSLSRLGHLRRISEFLSTATKSLNFEKFKKYPENLTYSASLRAGGRKRACFVKS